MAEAGAALETLRRIRDELNQTFVERSSAVEGALAALLARQHVLLIGPPGTAKSLLADELCRRIEGGRYFSWLLTRFTTPEELFGAVSLRALEQDEYRRITDRKLPEAHIAFLDEVFKASSAILNALLAILNERIFHNGRELQEVPLLTLFGATNELPEEDELAALYDRFLVRFVVDPVQEDFLFLRMLESRRPETRTTISLEALQELQGRVPEIPVPGGVLRTIAECRRELGRKNVTASDRRYRQALDVLRARALLDGRNEVDEEDLFFLEHVLWRDPGQRQTLQTTLRNLLQGHEDEARELLFQSRELREYARQPWDDREMRSRAVVEVHAKLRHILERIEGLLTSARQSGRPTTRMEEIRAEIEAIQEETLGSL